MALDGQAQAPDAGDDLAAFLAENEDADSFQGEPADGNEPGDEPDNSDPETQEDDPAEGNDPEGDEPDADDPDTAAKPDPGLKFKVPVKGEDGADTTIEVDEKELIAGYQRHSDYTKKTQDLAVQRDEVERVAVQRIDEGRNFFLQQAHAAQQAIVQLAGLKSPAEIAALAQTDPGLAFQETTRAEAINAVLGQIQMATQAAERQRAEEQHALNQRMYSSAWAVLGQNGIDKPKLQGIIDSVATTYGVDKKRFETVTDPKVILIMRDAIAFRQLQAKSKTGGIVQKKVASAPPLPKARQSSAGTASPAKSKAQANFRSGKASLRDLAQFVD